eukprot:1493547-Amphidinium_carterae.1
MSFGPMAFFAAFLFLRCFSSAVPVANDIGALVRVALQGITKGGDLGDMQLTSACSFREETYPPHAQNLCCMAPWIQAQVRFCV